MEYGGKILYLEHAPTTNIFFIYYSLSEIIAAKNMKIYGKLWSDPSNNFNIEVKAIIRPQACSFIKKESLAQVFSYEFCEIS